MFAGVFLFVMTDNMYELEIFSGEQKRIEVLRVDSLRPLPLLHSLNHIKNFYNVSIKDRHDFVNVGFLS